MTSVELIEITKRFGSILANDGVSIDIRPGEVHALLGENGAGKTTLMNILYGLYRPTSGQIVVDGAAVSIDSPRQALLHGIGMVHQHFMLVPTLTVAENYAIGQSPLWNTVSIGDFEQLVAEASARIGLPLDPKALISDLSVGQQQRVEIVRALGRGAKVLILDEPTAVLTPQEASELMQAIRSLTAQGTSVVFISHKLEEVMAISDRVSVLRSGRLIRTLPRNDTNAKDLASLMVGRGELRSAKRERLKAGAVAFRVRDLTVRDDRERDAVRGVSLELFRNEILGIAGVDGNGQAELCQALVGLRPAVSGSIGIGDRELVNGQPADFIRSNVSFVSDDRQVWGLFPDLSVAENLIADRHAVPPFARNGFLQKSEIRVASDGLVREFDVRPPDASLPVGNLSGGNKQKVVIGRAFASRPDVLIISQPTRGVDVGATEYIRQRMLDERKRGAAILMISADLDEVLALSDRIAVMYEGRIMATLAAEEAEVERLGLLMAGIKPH